MMKPFQLNKLLRGVLIIPRRQSLSRKEKVTFLKQIGVLLNAGIPARECMRLMETRALSSESRRLVAQVEQQIDQGISFSQALEDHVVFDHYTLHAIRLGEATGTLAESFEHASQEMQKENELRRQLFGALLYPLFVCVASLGLAVVLTIVIFPKLEPLFRSLKASLPWSTRLLLWLSKIMQHFWVYVIVGIGGVILLAYRLSQYANIKTSLHRLFLMLPIIGRPMRTFYLTRMCRALGLLLRRDDDLVRAIALAADVVSNTEYRAALRSAASSVSCGDTLSGALGRYPHLFPDTLVQMAAVGEKSGRLSELLYYVATVQEDEFRDTLRNLASLIEPILMIGVGLVVGFIALSVLAPIYSLTQSLYA